MTKNLGYFVGFSYCYGIGPMRFQRLLTVFGSIEKAYNAPAKDLEKVIDSQAAKKFDEFRKTFDTDRKVEGLRRKEITVVTFEDKNYPEALKNISDPPICLYVKGDLSTFDFKKERFFSIVGTRKPTSYGRQITQKFATELSTYNFVIVSGLALGIDSVAHISSLDSGGKTIAFLGCGVDIIYPPSNYKLYERIIRNKGLIISEFPPGQTVTPGLFVARNRLVSGISQGVLVVEGLIDSGALITARCAAEQGKEVFAIPSAVTSPLSAAPHLLLKQGAKMVTSVEDILSELKIRPLKKSILHDLNLEGPQKIMYDYLSLEPRLADELAVESQLPVYEVLSILSSLELQGIVEKNGEGKYQIHLH